MQQSTRNRAITTNVWTDLEDLQHVIDTVVGAHLETCEFTRDRVRDMKLRAKDCPNYTEPTRVRTRNLNLCCFRTVTHANATNE